MVQKEHNSRYLVVNKDLSVDKKDR